MKQVETGSFASSGLTKWKMQVPCHRAHTILDVINAEKQSEGTIWHVLRSLNVIAMAYATGRYLRADSMEDQILAASVLVRAGLLVAIVDTVGIAVSYSY
jgi:hypothetical protein